MTDCLAPAKFLVLGTMPAGGSDWVMAAVPCCEGHERLVGDFVQHHNPAHEAYLYDVEALPEIQRAAAAAGDDVHVMARSA